MVLTVEVVVVTINVYVHRIGVVRLVRYSANLLPSTARMMMVLFVEERGDVNVTDVCAITVMPVSGSIKHQPFYGNNCLKNRFSLRYEFASKREARG